MVEEGGGNGGDGVAYQIAIRYQIATRDYTVELVRENRGYPGSTPAKHGSERTVNRVFRASSWSRYATRCRMRRRFSWAWDTYYANSDNTTLVGRTMLGKSSRHRSTMLYYGPANATYGYSIFNPLNKFVKHLTRTNSVLDRKFSLDRWNIANRLSRSFEVSTTSTSRNTTHLK